MLPNKIHVSEGFNDLNTNSIGLIATGEPRFKDDIEYVRVDVDYSKYLDNILQKKLLNKGKSEGIKELLDYTIGFREGFNEAFNFLKSINNEKNYEEERDNPI